MLGGGPASQYPRL